MNILLIGHSKSGKTTIGNILADELGGKCVNTGDVILEEYMAAGGAYNGDKEPLRKKLFDFGNLKKATDPAYYAKKCLERGNIVTGVRTPVEFAACRAYFDVCFWIDRIGVEPNETDCLDWSYADCIIDNDEPLDIARERILQFVDGYLKVPECYIIGRYRHYKDGEYDLGKMNIEAFEEEHVSRFIYTWGFRPFSPCNIFSPIDKIMAPEQIIDLCMTKLSRMRPRYDIVVQRHGWKDHDRLPDSSGATKEYRLAKDRGLNIATTQHGLVVLAEYLETQRKHLGE